MPYAPQEEIQETDKENIFSGTVLRCVTVQLNHWAYVMKIALNITPVTMERMINLKIPKKQGNDCRNKTIIPCCVEKGNAIRNVK